MSDDEERRLQEERSAAGRLQKADGDVVAGLLATPNGRYWFERVLEFCKIYDMEHRSIDDTMITLGRKQVGAFLLDQIETYAPDAYLRMIQERRVRVETARVKRVDDEKVLRRAERPPDIGDMPERTPLEDMMDQQGRDLARDEAERTKKGKP